MNIIYNKKKKNDFVFKIGGGRVWWGQEANCSDNHHLSSHLEKP